MRLRGGMEERSGELFICGHRVGDLAGQYGTPLYLYNEEYIRAQCKAIRKALAAYPGKASAHYASKAFPSAAIDKLVSAEGLGVDVASQGELLVAMKAGIPMGDVMIHGAYKSDEYIDLAVRQNIKLIVIDSLPEIERVARAANMHGKVVDVLIRVNPGVEAETHKAVRTANLDTKFGIPLAGDLVRKAVGEILKRPALRLRGVHCHVGSQVFKMDVYDVAAGILLSFMKEASDMGACVDVLNIGGGYGCWYSRGDTPMQMLESVQVVAQAVQAHCARLKMEVPELMIEPGRAVVAESALAVYTAGVVKEIPGVNHYIVTDGGLYENPRPQLYGSRYSAMLVNRLNDKPERYYTVSGIACETDTLIRRVKLPIVSEGELIAMPTAGAYQLAMSGNYNRMQRPAAVLVNENRAALIQSRQTFEQVLECERIPEDLVGADVVGADCASSF